jgi:hypothetical protein
MKKFNLYFINDVALSKTQKFTSIKLSLSEAALSFLGIEVPYQCGVNSNRLWISIPGDHVAAIKAKAEAVAFEISERDIIDVVDDEGNSFGRTVSLDDIIEVPRK